jgi:hypothetical protein
LARKLSDITKTPSSMVGCSNCSAFNTLFAEHLTWHHDMELVLLLSGYNFLWLLTLFLCIYLVATSKTRNTLLYGSWTIWGRGCSFICIWLLGLRLCTVWGLCREASFCGKRIHTASEIHTLRSDTPPPWPSKPSLCQPSQFSPRKRSSWKNQVEWALRTCFLED